MFEVIFQPVSVITPDMIRDHASAAVIENYDLIFFKPPFSGGLGIKNIFNGVNLQKMIAFKSISKVMPAVGERRTRKYFF